MMRSHTTHDYYEILDLPSSSTPLSKQQLKLAYHRALLKHHPDKTQTPTQDTDIPDSPSFTIDEITAAYKTLSEPALRAEYDRARRLDRRPGREKATAFHTGLEVVDLEDLMCDEEGVEACWYRGCRCGDRKGFLVTETELEEEAEHGEIMIGCRGCSLWMKILFAVEEGQG